MREKVTDDKFYHKLNDNNCKVKSNTGSCNNDANDFVYVGDDEIDGVQTWNLNEKLESTKYCSVFHVELDAKVFDLKYFQENGFKSPILFKDAKGLGLRVPSESFTVEDVKRCVGSKRIIDVMEVGTQRGLTMNMKEWCAYYQNVNKRDKLLNVISLEFSHTKLENYVQAPTVVRQIDWIDNVWPQHLLESHTESTNVLDKMKYPKVQKYVLMSVAGCYTDFHIDMTGTSVWYHILKGEKMFWLIPPTENNIKMYERWVKSGQQENQFFADLVPEAERILLKQGHTFMIPSGWIHGVYTPKDSLVFGGNFLHSFNISMQLEVHNIETRLRVPLQIRFPFFFEMLWYAVERYAHCLTGYTHFKRNNSIDNENTDSSQSSIEMYKTFDPKKSDINLTMYECKGLEDLYNFLKNTPTSKRQVPNDITQPDELLERLKDALDEYVSKNNPTQQTTGSFITQSAGLNKAIVKCRQRKQKFPKSIHTFSSSIQRSSIIVDLLSGKGDNADLVANTNETTAERLIVKIKTEPRKHNMRKAPRTKGSIKKRLRPTHIPRSNIERRRRIRCRTCEPCTRDDCGECKYCKDMKKFGGQGVSKQCCLSKQCITPLLPSTTYCMYCRDQINRRNKQINKNVFECETCFEIYHSDCYKKKYAHLKNIDCVINEDLPNSWQCSNCIYKGYHRQQAFTNSIIKLPELSNANKINNNNNNKKMVANVINSYALYDYEENSLFDLSNNNNNNNNNDDSDYSNNYQTTLSIESLSNNEKEIILSEFCDIITDNDESTCDDNNLLDTINSTNSTSASICTASGDTICTTSSNTLLSYNTNTNSTSKDYTASSSLKHKHDDSETTDQNTKKFKSQQLVDEKRSTSSSSSNMVHNAATANNEFILINDEDDIIEDNNNNNIKKFPSDIIVIWKPLITNRNNNF